MALTMLERFRPLSLAPAQVLSLKGLRGLLITGGFLPREKKALTTKHCEWPARLEKGKCAALRP